MINCIANKIEQTFIRTRRFGKKIFDVQELNATAYHRRVGQNDIFTILDKDYNKLFVQNVKVKNAQEKESVTKFFSPGGREITIKSTMKDCG